jgi:hypothetical protein
MNATKRTVAALVAALMLAGCASSREVYTPSGELGYVISCDGVGWAVCYTKASDLCGAKGYQIIKQQSDQEAAGYGGTYAWGVSSSSTRTLLVQCGS